MTQPLLQNTQLVQTLSSKANPNEFVYAFLKLASGPTGTGGLNYNMDTASDSTPSVFEWEVPAGRTFTFVRINFVIIDASMSPGDFGGISGPLTNGCLFEIIDENGSQILDFTDGVPIATNADFTPLAGSDTEITELVGDDLLPIRFTIAKAGEPMTLIAGQKIRWTNRDDVSGLTKFRAMIQGTYST